MAKIKVNISGEAFTGKIVTFKAPCDCTEATGLVIGEDTYDVVDALGNCITGSYLAWRGGAVVSVALDVDSKKAFLQNEKPTPAAIGAAPAGYGLGMQRLPQINLATLNQTFAAGWYAFRDIENTIDGSRVGLVCCHGMPTSSNVCVQDFYTFDGMRAHIRRLYVDGSWINEYVNPPMKLGVEYRTTERYLNKPVYVVAVDFPSCPNKGVLNVQWRQDGICRPFHVYGVASNGNALPYLVDTASMKLGVDGGQVYMTTESDRSSLSAVVIIKYTKLTD